MKKAMGPLIFSPADKINLTASDRLSSARKEASSKAREILMRRMGVIQEASAGKLRDLDHYEAAIKENLDHYEAAKMENLDHYENTKKQERDQAKQGCMDELRRLERMDAFEALREGLSVDEVQILFGNVDAAALHASITSTELLNAPDDSPPSQPPLAGAQKVTSLKFEIGLISEQLMEFKDAVADGTCMWHSLIISGCAEWDVPTFVLDIYNRMIDENNQEKIRRLFAHPQYSSLYDLKQVLELMRNPSLYQKSYPGEIELMIFNLLYGITVVVIQDFCAGQLLAPAINTEIALQAVFPGFKSESPYVLYLYRHRSGHPINPKFSTPDHYGALVPVDKANVPSDAEIYIGGMFSIRLWQFKTLWSLDSR